MQFIKTLLNPIICLILILPVGCAPLFLGTGTMRAFKVSSDDRSTGTIIEDSTVEIKVKSALLNAPDIKGGKIDVDVINATVYLTGGVMSEKESQGATEIAASVRYVKRVKNDLHIGKRGFVQAIHDGLMSSKIKSQLIKAPGIRSLNIDVDVYHGVAYLTGTAKNDAERETVLKIADRTYGTTKVVDNINIIER